MDGTRGHLGMQRSEVGVNGVGAVEVLVDGSDCDGSFADGTGDSFD